MEFRQKIPVMQDTAIKGSRYMLPKEMHPFTIFPWAGARTRNKASTFAPEYSQDPEDTATLERMGERISSRLEELKTFFLCS